MRWWWLFFESDIVCFSLVLWDQVEKRLVKFCLDILPNLFLFFFHLWTFFTGETWAKTINVSYVKWNFKGKEMWFVFAKLILTTRGWSARLPHVFFCGSFNFSVLTENKITEAPRGKWHFLLLFVSGDQLLDLNSFLSCVHDCRTDEILLCC